MRDLIAAKEILTREEVMEVLKIGRSTFYKLIQTGQLKGFKEGNRYKVPVESIEEYVDKRMKLWHIEIPKALGWAFGTFIFLKNFFIIIRNYIVLFGKIWYYKI